MQETLVVTFIVGFALLRLALPVVLLLLVGSWFGARGKTRTSPDGPGPSGPAGIFSA
jgi:hypothetical protein